MVTVSTPLGAWPGILAKNSVSAALISGFSTPPSTVGETSITMLALASPVFSPGKPSATRSKPRVASLRKSPKLSV